MSGLERQIVFQQAVNQGERTSNAKPGQVNQVLYKQARNQEL